MCLQRCFFHWYLPSQWIFVLTIMCYRLYKTAHSFMTPECCWNNYCTALLLCTMCGTKQTCNYSRKNPGWLFRYVLKMYEISANSFLEQLNLRLIFFTKHFSTLKNRFVKSEPLFANHTESKEILWTPMSVSEAKIPHY